MLVNRSIKFYQITLAILLVALLLVTRPILNWFTPPERDEQLDKVSIGSDILRHINLYSSFENPIALDELFAIAQQEFEHQQRVGDSLDEIETEYLLTLVESNLMMKRFEQAKSLLGQIAPQVNHLPLDSAFNQRLTLQYFMMEIWLNAETGNHSEAKGFLTRAEQTPVDDIRQQEIFWQLQVTKFSLYLQLGMFDTLLVEANTLIPILERQHDREIGILTTRLYDDYSTALFMLNRNQAAIVALEKAADWDQKVFSDNHLGRGARLNKLAMIHTMDGQYKTAIEHYQQGLDILQHQEKPNYFTLALDYSNMSAALFELGQTAAAFKQIDRSIELAEQHLQSSGGVVGYFYLIKATYLFYLQDYQQAKALLDIASPIITTRSAQSHPAQARLLTLKAQLGRELGDAATCNKYSRLAMSKYQQIYNQPNHWEQKLADMTNLSCQLIGKVTGEPQYEQHMAVIRQTLNQIKSQHKKDALPVRRFQRGLGL